MSKSIEQLYEDYQAQLRAFHKRNGRDEQRNATVTAIRQVPYTGSAGR